MCALTEEIRGRHEIPPTGELERYVTATTGFLDAIEDAFYVCDSTGELRRWNERLCEWTGYDDAELGSMTLQECMGESNVRDVDRALQDVIETGTARWKAVLETATGTKHTVEFTATLCDEVVDERRIVGTGRLIAGPQDSDKQPTEATREQTAEEMPVEQTDEQYRRRLYDVTSDPSLDADEKIDRLLELGCERLGMKNGLLAEVGADAEHYEVVRATDSWLLEQGMEITLEESYLRRVIGTDAIVTSFDGDENDLIGSPSGADWSAGCYVGSNIAVQNELNGILCFFDDASRSEPFTRAERAFVDLICRWITHMLERRTRERELRAANERLEAVIEASPAALVAIDFDGTVELWNAAAERIFGYDEAEVLGEPIPTVPEELGAEYEQLREQIARGEPVRRKETKRLRDDGTLIDVTLSAAPVRDSDGTIVGIMGAFEDITDRKTAQRALRERESELKRYKQFTDSVLDAIDDIFYVLDSSGNFKRWNESLAEVTGYGDEEIAERNGITFFHEPDQQHVAKRITESFENGHGRLEAPLQTKDGESIPFEFVASTVEDPDGNTVLAGIGRDISERLENEQALRERERELATLMENVPGIVYRCRNEPDWPFEFVSEGCRELTGYDPAALVEGKLNWAEDVIVGDNEELWETVQAALGDNEPFNVTYQIETESGERRWFWEQGRGVFDDGELEALEGVILDVTERKQKELELDRTRNLLEQAQRLADLGAWEIDVDEQPPDVWWNAEIGQILCRPPDTEYTLEDVLEFYHEDDRPAIRRAIDRAVEDGESFDLEVRLFTDDGERRWVRALGEPVTENGTVGTIRGSIQDITERKERERELERTKQLLEHAQKMASVGGYQIEVADGSPAVFTATEDAHRLLGIADSKSLEFDEVLEYVHPADEDRFVDAIEGAIETADSFDVEVRARTRHDEWVWSRATGEVMTDGGTVVSIEGAVQDVDDQKRHRLALESLHDATRGLLGTDSDHEIAELVVDTATEVLDLSGVAIYTLDTEEGTLNRIVTTDAFTELVGGEDPVAVGSSDSIVWNAFASGSTQLANGELEDPRFEGETAGLAVPIGDHGVLVAARQGSAVTGSTRQLVETLVATTAAAFDRLESEAALRERETELADQNEQLKRQVQINEIIRSIDRSLVRTGTREAIETAVCDRLVEVDWIDFAWIGEPNASQTALDPRTWSGTSPEYLDRIPLDDPTMDGDPAWAAVQTGEPRVVETVLEGIQTEGWRKQALVHGYQSIVSVPLAYEEYTYGVLTVYASEAGAFDDLERSVFAELGANIASSINAVETRRALHTDASLEVTLGFEQPEALLARLARQAECTVCYESLVADEGEQSRLFVTVEQASMDAVRAVLEELHAVQEWSVVSERDGDDEDGDGDGEPDGETLVALTVSCPTLAEKLVRHGGRPRSITATPAGLEVVVDLPMEADVREHVEMLTDQFGPAKLQSRRTVERELRTRRGHVASLLESLTDRQLEVLRTAYFGGFFEWPRESTGEEVAELLDVSQPTVNRHLRLGQRALLAQLFGHDRD